MLHTAFRTAAAAACLAFALGAAPAGAQDDPVLAVVNGEEIHKSELVEAKEQLGQQIPQVQQMPLEAILPGLLDRAINQRLILAEAEKADMGDDPEVQKQLDQIKKELMQRVYLERQVEERISEDRLRQAYEDFKAENPPEDQVHARHILVEDEATAKEVIAKLNDGASFEDLAKEESVGPSGPRGGDLGYFAKGAMVPEFAEAAFAMEPGEVSQEPVKTQFGWHVIKVEDRRQSEPPAFEEMKEQLRGQLADEVAQSVIADLRDKADVDMKLDTAAAGAKAGAPVGAKQ